MNNLQNIECAFDTGFEKKYWNFFLMRLKLILSTYKTSLEEDLKLISDNKLSSNSILAIRMRASEKTILKSAIEYAEQRMKN